MASNSGRRPGLSPILKERFGSLLVYLWAHKSLAQKSLAPRTLAPRTLAPRTLAPRTLVLAVALMAVGILPAQAEELKDWQYDAQTRSLTLTLPDSVVPFVSVVAPDQLVLELPDTQVGDVMSQSIRDGVVENIILEQATPETVLIVMDFAAGTVLSASQNAIPLAETESGEQQWQVRPALVAASRQAVTQTAASQSMASADIPNESAASALRTPEPEVAQLPDFSDLPVLEPARSISESVSVPPLNAPPAVRNDSAASPVPVPALEDATASAAQFPAPADRTYDSLDDSLNESGSEAPSSVFEIEVIPAELPVATEVEPVEPPFLSDFEDGSQSIPVQQLPDEPSVVDRPISDDRIASGPESIEPVAIEPVAEVTELEPIVPSNNTSRWPEPIPFGQPLPR